MKKILITGGTGFVGKALVPALKSEYDVEVASSQDMKSKLFDCGQNYDYIIHMAVKTAAGGYCQNHSGEQFLVNTDINNAFFQGWKNCFPNAKVITFGSSCGYDADVEKTEANYLKGEAEPGYEVYGNIKRNLLVGCQAMEKEYGMKYSYLIPSTLYGPNYELNDRHFIFDLIRKIVDAKQNGGEVVLWGDGYQRRELIYIDDAVKIIKHALTWNLKICNLSSGQDYSIRDYAQTICNIVDYDFNSIKFDTNQFVGSLSKKMINTNLTAIDFTPLEDGLRKTIEYYVSRSSSSK
jgi:GDP-L-fucose synthase